VLGSMTIDISLEESIQANAIAILSNVSSEEKSWAAIIPGTNC
jgi:hypothetical protein